MTTPNTSSHLPPLLEVKNLKVGFSADNKTLNAVDDVSFSINPGEILGLVGESGSGKSLTLRSVAGLTRRYASISGDILWKGENISALSENKLRTIRGRQIAMIFQEPMSSLNPLLTVGLQIDESLVAHTKLTRSERRERAIDLLNKVGIPDPASRIADYPHQFSGGMRQRVMIAISLACDPELLLADEPTTALDVTIQAQILKLITQLAEEMKMAVILVTHDLGVAAQSCDRLAVMYGGKLVENGPVRKVLKTPLHPYTSGLLRAVPDNVKPRTPLFTLKGTPPGLGDIDAGCAFAPRCMFATDQCRTLSPTLTTDRGDQAVACYFPGQRELETLA